MLWGIVRDEGGKHVFNPRREGPWGFPGIHKPYVWTEMELLEQDGVKRLNESGGRTGL